MYLAQTENEQLQKDAQQYAKDFGFEYEYRLVEIFGDVELVPGISSIQVAASKTRVPLDKSKVITMHVTTSIEEKKLDLQKAVVDGYNIILIPRPWPPEPNLQ